MSERAMWSQLRRRMAWDAQRHEDVVSRGVPDVSYATRGVDGWIELKYLRAWPAREATPVRLDQDRHKFLRQLHWLQQRGRAGGGRCFVLLRVGRREWLLLRPDLRLANGMRRADLPVVWTSREGLDPDALLKELTL